MTGREESNSDFIIHFVNVCFHVFFSWCQFSFDQTFYSVCQLSTALNTLCFSKLNKLLLFIFFVCFFVLRHSRVTANLDLVNANRKTWNWIRERSIYLPCVYQYILRSWIWKMKRGVISVIHFISIEWQSQQPGYSWFIHNNTTQ